MSEDEVDLDNAFLMVPAAVPMPATAATATPTGSTGVTVAVRKQKEAPQRILPTLAEWMPRL